jgi:hypothetical protein
MKSSKVKKCMDLNEMKKSLGVKTHIKAGEGDPSPRYAVVNSPGQGDMHQRHTGG